MEFQILKLGAFGDEKCDMGIYGVFEEVVFRLTKNLYRFLQDYIPQVTTTVFQFAHKGASTLVGPHVGPLRRGVRVVKMKKNIKRHRRLAASPVNVNIKQYGKNEFIESGVSLFFEASLYLSKRGRIDCVGNIGRKDPYGMNRIFLSCIRISKL